jgi:multiple sugar transport system permease protein
MTSTQATEDQMNLPADQPATRSVRMRFHWLTDKRMAVLFLLPTMVLLLAIAIFPLIWSLRLSFTEWSVIGDAGEPAVPVGFENYEAILGLGESPSQLRLGREVADRFAITGRFVIPAVTIELVLGFGLAWLLHRTGRGRGLLMTLLLVPMMLTPVVVALFWRYIFRTDIGVLNYLLGVSVDWLNRIDLAMWALVLVDIWMWTPFMMLISLAGLAAVPEYLYEAADVDRASGWFKFRHITLPMVTPLLLIGILFRTMDAYKLFDQAWVLTGGGPGRVTQTMSFYLYLTAFNDFDTGLGSAIGYIMLVVIIALATVLIRRLNQLKGTG